MTPLFGQDDCLFRLQGSKGMSTVPFNIKKQPKTKNRFLINSLCVLADLQKQGWLIHISVSAVGYSNKRFFCGARVSELWIVSDSLFFFVFVFLPFFLIYFIFFFLSLHFCQFNIFFSLFSNFKTILAGLAAFQLLTLSPKTDWRTHTLYLCSY